MQCHKQINCLFQFDTIKNLTLLQMIALYDDAERSIVMEVKVFSFLLRQIRNKIYVNQCNDSLFLQRKFKI